MQPIRGQARAILHEEAQAILTTFAEAAFGSNGDFSVVEGALHTALLQIRKACMGAGLILSCEGSRRTYLCPTCGEALHAWLLGERCVVTAEGEARYHPTRYRCLTCARDHYPLEEANGLAGSQFTTGAKALIADAAAASAYSHVSEWLLSERGVPVSPKEVDRTVREVSDWRKDEEKQLTEAVYGDEAAQMRASGADPLGAAPRLHEFAGWNKECAALISVDGAMVRSCHKGTDGALEWFEHRAGVIAPAHEDSRGDTVYAAGVCSPDALFDGLGARWRQSGNTERTCVFVADGARWIWERVRLYFPQAVEVLDIYHAAEHVASAANACWGEGSARAQSWRSQAREVLLRPGGASAVIRQFISALRQPGQVVDPEDLKKELRYLLGHRHRMRYAKLKERGLPVGSGAMESAIKQLSTYRLKQPGMKWTKAGADAVLRVRAARLSGSLRHTVSRKHAGMMHLAQSRYRAPASATVTA